MVVGFCLKSSVCFCDGVDVSVPVLDKHYDQRSEERKSRRRREVLEANMDQYAMTDGGRPMDEGEW